MLVACFVCKWAATVALWMNTSTSMTSDFNQVLMLWLLLLSQNLTAQASFPRLPAHIIEGTYLDSRQRRDEITGMSTSWGTRGHDHLPFAMTPQPATVALLPSNLVPSLLFARHAGVYLSRSNSSASSSIEMSNPRYGLYLWWLWILFTLTILPVFGWFKSWSPILTNRSFARSFGFLFLSTKQCAAVMTYLEATKVPPQKPLCLVCNLTSQGYLFG